MMTYHGNVSSTDRLRSEYEPDVSDRASRHISEISLNIKHCSIEDFLAGTRDVNLDFYSIPTAHALLD